MTIAAGTTGVFAVVLAALAVTSLVSRHGTFSLGVTIMLAVYSLLIGFIAWSAWRCAMYAWGVLIASAVLHLLVALSSFSSNPLLWSVVIVGCLAVIGGGLAPSTRRALHRTKDTADDLPPL